MGYHTQGKQLGGAPSNCIYHGIDKDIEGYVITAVGDDENGREIMNRLKELNVHTDFVQTTSEYPTGTVGVELDEEGKPDYQIYENVAWDHIEWKEYLRKLAANLDGVCFGSLFQRNHVSRNTIHKFLESTNSSCTRVFDVNLRQGNYNRQVILKSLERADVVKLNEEELPVLSNYLGYTDELEDVLQKLLKDYELHLIAYTKGSEGSLLMSQGDQSYMEVPDVKVADTIGAGDAFTGILLKGLLQGVDLRSIHQTSTEVAAYVCTQQAATPKVTDDILKF
ncbi:MAG: carbohydrate kinase [Bacteroidales bacterium]|nr:carbohydrate kinase [Bacteroidales bacterium]